MAHPDLSTPTQLAHELHVSRRRVRQYLFERFGTEIRPWGQRWQLSEEQADEVRRAFSRGDKARPA